MRQGEGEGCSTPVFKAAGKDGQAALEAAALRRLAVPPGTEPNGARSPIGPPAPDLLGQVDHRLVC